MIHNDATIVVDERHTQFVAINSRADVQALLRSLGFELLYRAPTVVVGDVGLQATLVGEGRVPTVVARPQRWGLRAVVQSAGTEAPSWCSHSLPTDRTQ